MDCIVHGVAKSQTPLSDFHFTSLPPMTLRCPQFPHTNSPAKLPLSSETLPTPFFSEHLRTFPFKIKL